MIWIILGLIAWFGCGFIAAGYHLASYVRGVPMLAKYGFKGYQQYFLCVTIPCGLASLFVNAIFYSGYGWLNPWGKKAKQEAGIV